MSTTNLTLEQANTLLSQLGVDVAVVANEDDATKDVELENIVSNIVKEPESTGITKEEYSKKVSSEVGKVFGTFRTALAREFGLKISDLEALEAKDIASKLKDTVQTRYTHTEKELREQLEAVTNQLNSKEEDFANKYSSLESEWKSKFEQRDVLDIISKSFKDIPNKAKDLSKVAHLAYSEWQQKYDIKQNPLTKEVQFFEKGTEDIAMDGKNPIKPDVLAKLFVADLGLDVSDTSHIPPSDVVNTKGQGANYQSGVQQQMGVAGSANVSGNFAGLINELGA